MSAPTHITHIGLLQAICKDKVNYFFLKKQVFESLEFENMLLNIFLSKQNNRELIIILHSKEIHILCSRILPSIFIDSSIKFSVKSIKKRIYII